MTATYGGDAYHAPSSGKFTVFVGKMTNSGATSTSVTCDDSYVQVGQHTTCHATVTSADGKTPGGSVSWTADASGSFSHIQCGGAHGDSQDNNGNLSCQADYTTNAPGHHVITAAYSGDGTHTASSGTFDVFAQNKSDLSQQAAIALPAGALLAVGLSVVVLDAKERSKKQSSA